VLVWDCVKSLNNTFGTRKAVPNKKLVYLATKKKLEFFFYFFFFTSVRVKTHFLKNIK
jgi:hypothetical protein